MVMLVRIQAPDRIFPLEPFLLQEIQNAFFIRDLIVAYNQAFIHAHWLVEMEPRMGTNLSDFVALLWVCV